MDTWAPMTAVGCGDMGGRGPREVRFVSLWRADVEEEVVVVTDLRLFWGSVGAVVLVLVVIVLLWWRCSLLVRGDIEAGNAK